MGWFSKDKCAACGEEILAESDIDQKRVIEELGPKGLASAIGATKAHCSSCGRDFHRMCANIDVQRGLIWDTTVMHCPKCGKTSSL
jgi:DNA-directed RNA polymerase subunit RPC12/RpoP